LRVHVSANLYFYTIFVNLFAAVFKIFKSGKVTPPEFQTMFGNFFGAWFQNKFANTPFVKFFQIIATIITKNGASNSTNPSIIFY